MKKCLIALCCLMYALPVLSAKNCPETPVNVHIKIADKTPRYDNTLSRDEFLKFAPHANPENAIGLTVADLNVSQRLAYATAGTIQQACAYPTDLYFEIGYDRLDVYIDKKYKPGSCAYRVVKEHEDYHVEVARQALSFFEPDLRERLESMKDKLNVSYSYYPQLAEEDLLKKFNSAFQKEVGPLLQHINNKLNEKNAEIDTPESYAATQALCKDW